MPKPSVWRRRNAASRLSLLCEAPWLSRAVYTKLQKCLTSDAIRLHKGTVLKEVDHPCEPFISFPEIISAHNNSGGYCSMCKNPFSDIMAPVEHNDLTKKRPTNTWKSREMQMASWKCQREENWLMHVVSNHLAVAICLACNIATSGEEKRGMARACAM